VCEYARDEVLLAPPDWAVCSRSYAVGVVALVPDNIPGELKSLDRWCLWRYEEDDSGRISKPPYQARAPSLRAWPNDPDTWAPFWQALNAHNTTRRSDGIAIALEPDLGILGIDLDYLDRWTDRDQPWDIVRTINSYTELSPSLNGYRIFCYADMPEGRRVRDFVQLSNQRIFTVTGNTLNVSRHLEHRQAQVDEVHHVFLGT